MTSSILPGNVPTQTVLLIGAHYILRFFCESTAMLSISPTVFRGYFSNAWVDMSAIVLTMVAYVWNEANEDFLNGLNTFVVGLLWIKVIGLLKVVNKDMSTFVLSLIEILGDIRNFMLVLLVVVFMFGDMLHIAGRLVAVLSFLFLLVLEYGTYRFSFNSGHKG